MANAHTVKLPFKKETKNMLQYQAPDDEKNTSPMPTAYVRKDLFDSSKEWPPFLKITVEGVAKATSVPQLGATLTFTAKTASAYPSGAASVSFSGTVTKVDDRGTSKGFVSVSITAESYELITY